MADEKKPVSKSSFVSKSYSKLQMGMKSIDPPKTNNGANKEKTKNDAANKKKIAAKKLGAKKARREPSPFDPYAPDRSMGDYFCKVCDSHMNSSQMWDSHVQGKRHEKNVKKHATGESTPQQKTDASSEEALFNLELEGIVHPIVGLKYICEIRKRDPKLVPVYKCFLCSSCLATAAILMDHLYGTKHKLAYIKETDLECHKTIESMGLTKGALETLTTDTAAQLEKKHGRGTMQVEYEKPPPKTPKHCWGRGRTPPLKRQRSESEHSDDGQQDHLPRSYHGDHAAFERRNAFNRDPRPTIQIHDYKHSHTTPAIAERDLYAMESYGPALPPPRDPYGPDLPPSRGPYGPNLMPSRDPYGPNLPTPRDLYDHDRSLQRNLQNRDPSPRRPYDRDLSPRRPNNRNTSPRAFNRDLSPRRQDNRNTSPRPYNRDLSPRRPNNRNPSPRPFDRDRSPLKRQYDRDPSPRRSLDRGASPKRTYDRGASPKRTYDRGASPKRTYDRGASPKRTYDRGASPRRSYDHNSSPQRSAYDHNSSPPPRRTYDRDYSSSPQRKTFNRDSSPQRKNFNRDSSSPQRKNFNRDSSPQRKNFNRDSSPQRKNFNRDSSSPQRKTFKRDITPPTRRQGHDNSPPRRSEAEILREQQLKYIQNVQASNQSLQQEMKSARNLPSTQIREEVRALYQPVRSGAAAANDPVYKTSQGQSPTIMDFITVVRKTPTRIRLDLLEKLVPIEPTSESDCERMKCVADVLVNSAMSYKFMSLHPDQMKKLKEVCGIPFPTVDNTSVSIPGIGDGEYRRDIQQFPTTSPTLPSPARQQNLPPSKPNLRSMADSFLQNWQNATRNEPDKTKYVGYPTFSQ